MGWPLASSLELKSLFLFRAPARETPWLVRAASHSGSCQESTITLVHDGHGLLNRKYKDIRTRWGRNKKRKGKKKRGVPLWASFCRRILRRCRAEEETSYVYRSAAATSWHLPNTPSAGNRETSRRNVRNVPAASIAISQSKLMFHTLA